MESEAAMMKKLWRRVRDKRGFTGTQMMAASLMTLLSAVLAIQTMIFALNRTETANWTSRAQVLCTDASRSVQNWLSRASGVEPGLPSDGSVKEAELVCFLAADADGTLLWRAFRGGTLESWAADNTLENPSMGGAPGSRTTDDMIPLLSDANDLSYRFDPETGAYDFGPDGRAAVSVQVFCVEEEAAIDGETAAVEEAAAADGESTTVEDETAVVEESATDGEKMAEYLFRAEVSVLPVGGGDGVVNTFRVRPMLAPPMRAIQREEAIAEDTGDAENMEDTENAAESAEDTENAENTDGVEAHPPALETEETLPATE